MEGTSSDYVSYVFFDNTNDEERKEPVFPASMKQTREKQLEVRGLAGKLVPSKTTGIKPTVKGLEMCKSQRFKFQVPAARKISVGFFPGKS